MAGREDYSVETFLGEYRNERTVAMRRHHLGQFLAWLETEDIHVLAVEPQDVIRYVDAMRKRYAVSTSVAIQRSLRAYYLWLERRGTISRSPLAHVKDKSVPANAPRYVTPEAVRRMLAVSTSDRNWAFLSIIAFNSLRVSELLSCNVSDLQQENGRWVLHFRPVAESRRRRSFVVLAEPSADALRRYIGNRQSGPIFITRDGGKLTRAGISGSAFLLTARRAQLGYDVTPEMVRNCLAATALSEGFSYRGVIKAIGIPDRRHSENWLALSGPDEVDNASLRLARLVLNPPDTVGNTLLHVESLLFESDLPEGFAVVAACATFEAHLYDLCLAHGLEVPVERKDGGIQKYVHTLYRAKLLNLAELKLCEGIGVARNNAAHGAFDLLQPDAGRQVLRSVREFVAAHPVPSATG